jgi:DNA-binding MarR family transcriptional regulator
VLLCLDAKLSVCSLGALSGEAPAPRFVPEREKDDQQQINSAALRIAISIKYVNMTDIISLSVDGTMEGSKTAATGGRKPLRDPTWDLIELLFFAYRDFVSDPDHVLAALKFGRAHHRVLHFTTRNPGMTVADLLDILRITKQSLGRVLKQLIDQGYVEQKEGPQDRRQRLLYVTPKGEALAMRLARLQSHRIAQALAEVGPGAQEAARRFLAAMIDADERDSVLRLIAEADRRTPD